MLASVGDSCLRSLGGQETVNINKYDPHMNKIYRASSATLDFFTCQRSRLRSSMQSCNLTWTGREIVTCRELLLDRGLGINPAS